jgi:hypothetical protein
MLYWPCRGLATVTPECLVKLTWRPTVIVRLSADERSLLTLCVSAAHLRRAGLGDLLTDLEDGH